MEYIWKLLTSIFLIVVSLALFVAGWIFSNGTFSDYFTGLSLFVTLAGIVWGTCRGIAAIIGYQKEHKKEE